MDGGSFDRMTRLLVRGVSRRTGIGLALGSLLGWGSLGTGGADAKRGANRRGDKLPCLNVGSGCVADDECCSGRCLPKSGGTGFRCGLRRRAKERGDRSEPVGCVSDVCATGCAYTTVEAAYAAAAPGSTIYIGTGTYQTQIAITKDMTFDACKGEDPVLEPARISRGPDSSYSIFMEDVEPSLVPLAVTIRNLTLRGTATGNTESDETLVSSYGHGKVNWTIDKTTIMDASSGFNAKDGEHVFTTSRITNTGDLGVGVEASGLMAATLTMTGTTFADNTGAGVNLVFMEAVDGMPCTAHLSECTFSGNTYAPFRIYGPNSVAGRELAVANLTDCTFTGNFGTDTVKARTSILHVSGCTFDGNTDQESGAIYFSDSSGTVHDSTFTDNTGEYAGAISAETYTTSSVTLDVTGRSSFTSNSGTNAGAILAWKGTASDSVVVSVDDSVTFTTNTPYSCVNHVEGGSENQVDCYTWA